MNALGVKGFAWKFGNDVDTDQILPGRYLAITNPEELADHCLEDYRPSFRKVIMPGDIVVAGTNFGCGSSREHAPLAMKTLGLGCILAESYARIFFRNCINLGMPALICPGAISSIKEGDELLIDIKAGHAKNLTQEKSFLIEPLPDILIEILNHGGLTALARERVTS